MSASESTEGGAVEGHMVHLAVKQKEVNYIAGHKC